MPGGIVSDDDFWRLLSEREIVREPIVDRYERGFRPIGTFSGPGRLASPYEGLIRDGREMLFDRNLFGMSHNEMLTADPHVRMLLTCTWETCERAGWDLHALCNSRTGVFVVRWGRISPCCGTPSGPGPTPTSQHLPSAGI